MSAAVGFIGGVVGVGGVGGGDVGDVGEQWKGISAGSPCTAVVQIPEHEVVFARKAHKVLHGRYRKGARLGRGSYGVVKEAMDCTDGTVVAIKTYHMRRRRIGCADRVRREVHMLSLVSHPNVVQLKEHWVSKHKTYLVLSYADAGTLSAHVDARVLDTSRALCEYGAQLYFRQALNAVSYLHKMGIAHKDVKPENMLLCTDNTLMLCDFDCAQEVNKQDEVVQFEAIGSPAFQPPEVARGETHVDPFSVDMWALGVSLYYMVTGELPYASGGSLSSLLDAVSTVTISAPLHSSSALSDVLTRMLNTNAHQRMTCNDVSQHEWILQQQLNCDCDCDSPKRLRSQLCPLDCTCDDDVDEDDNDRQSFHSSYTSSTSSGDVLCSDVSSASLNISTAIPSTCSISSSTSTSSLFSHQTTEPRSPETPESPPSPSRSSSSRSRRCTIL